MKSPSLVEAITMFIMGIVLSIGGSLSASAQGSVTIHQALVAKLISVEIIETTHVRSRGDHDVVVARAAGFSAGDCDIVTTFDVVVEYDRRQTWPEVRQRIDVIIAGIRHKGVLRPVGVYPERMNLACIDFAPSSREVVYPLFFATDLPSPLFLEGELSGADPGAPLVNEKGRVVAMLMTGQPSPQFIAAPDIQRFLKMAAAVPRSDQRNHYRLVK